jgi:hypothetical protein
MVVLIVRMESSGKGRRRIHSSLCTYLLDIHTYRNSDIALLWYHACNRQSLTIQQLLVRSRLELTFWP